MIWTAKRLAVCQPAGEDLPVAETYDPASPVLLTLRGVGGHSYSTGHFVAPCLFLWLFVSTGPHPAAWLKPAYIPAKQPGKEGKPLLGNQPGMQELLGVMPHGEQRRRALAAANTTACWHPERSALSRGRTIPMSEPSPCRQWGPRRWRPPARSGDARFRSSSDLGLRVVVEAGRLARRHGTIYGFLSPIGLMLGRYFDHASLIYNAFLIVLVNAVC